MLTSNMQRATYDADLQHAARTGATQHAAVSVQDATFTSDRRPTYSGTHSRSPSFLSGTSPSTTSTTRALRTASRSGCRRALVGLRMPPSSPHPASALPPAGSAVAFPTVQFKAKRKGRVTQPGRAPIDCTHTPMCTRARTRAVNVCAWGAQRVQAPYGTVKQYGTTVRDTWKVQVRTHPTHTHRHMHVHTRAHAHTPTHTHTHTRQRA